MSSPIAYNWQRATCWAFFWFGLVIALSVSTLWVTVFMHRTPDDVSWGTIMSLTFGFVALIIVSAFSKSLPKAGTDAPVIASIHELARSQDLLDTAIDAVLAGRLEPGALPELVAARARMRAVVAAVYAAANFR